VKHTLIFANGDINDGPMVQRALSVIRDSAAITVIAADGGARVAQHFGLPIDTVIGDMDSLTTDEIDALGLVGTEVLRYPPEKDATDLELALKLAASRDARWIRIIGGLGDRFDQTLSNIYLMGLPELEGRDMRLVAGKQEMWLLYPGRHKIHGTSGDTVSLLPLGGAVHGITTDALFYPLRGESLEFGPARGISNVMDSDLAGVTLELGVLLVVHTVGRA
jgi:thiamine pyrophosphokinase